MNSSFTRRRFLQASTFVTAGAWLGALQAAPRKSSANDRLNIGMIGTANRAGEDLSKVSGENIAALCDIDDTLLAAAQKKFPRAKTYNDFRKMLEQADLDAIVVGSADHTHAVATSMALQLGKHVYCEKPLTHTIFEARTITNLAAKNPKLATQMGTQIHAGDNYRRAVELVQSGAIGEVRECHVWCVKTLPGGERPTDTPPIPAGLHWDLWLGPVAERPYSPEYIPKTWRRWWAFGEGIFGDMACHYMDLAFWALKLGSPTTVQAEGPPPHPETVPAWTTAHYEFPAREKLPPVRLTWYDGGKQPVLIAEGKVSDWPNGVLFVGKKGMLLADYGKHLLLPEEKFKAFRAPEPFIPKSMGHHNEWVQACKTGSPTTCNFAYAGNLTEAVLLGIIAYRSGQKIDWDAARLKAKNCPQAEAFIRTEYRQGWKL